MVFCVAPVGCKRVYEAPIQAALTVRGTVELFDVCHCVRRSPLNYIGVVRLALCFG